MIAVVGSNGIETIARATELRRRGVSVYTQFQGNRKRQLARAYARCALVIDLDNKDCRPGIAFDATFDGQSAAGIKSGASG